jgi:hypothetical protein
MLCFSLKKPVIELNSVPFLHCDGKISYCNRKIFIGIRCIFEFELKERKFGLIVI